MLIRLVISLFVLLWAVPSHAAPLADCAQATVAAAVAAATAGDTVTIPACAATTWDDPVAIDKNLTISGDSPTTTTLRTNDEASTSADGIFTIADNVVVIIKNIGFTTTVPIDTNAYNAPIWFNGDTHTGSVIYNCKFDGHKWAIFGWELTGVAISKNSFIDGGVQLYGSSTAWNSAITLGDGNWTFIEGNTFTAQRGQAIHFILGYAGAKYVARYNSFVSTDGTGYVSDPVDAHGYGHGSGATGHSTRGWDVYNNYFVTAGSESRGFIPRGGSGTAHDNLFNEINNAYAYGEIYLWEYRQYASILYGPTGGNQAGCGTPTSAVTGYCADVEGVPCCESIGMGPSQAQDAAYFWGNYKCTTAPCTSNKVAINPTVAADSVGYITLNEDYYNAEKSGYSKYACPHDSVTDLAGTGCDSTLYGTTGYGVATTFTVTPSKVGAAGTIYPSLAETVSSGGNSSVYTATVPNGWRVTWGGTGGCTGNGTTCQVLNVTADKTVIATFETIKIGGVR